MAYSDKELEMLYGGSSPVTLSTPPVTEELPGEIKVPYKRAKQIANIIPKGINAVWEGIQHTANLLDPTLYSKEDLEDTKSPLPSFDTGESQGTMDFVLDKVAPEIAGWTIPYLGLSKIGKVASAARGARILTEGVAQGGANFLMGAKSEETALPFVSGGVGFGSGVVQAALPRMARALPLAAVSAIEGVAHDNWIGAGANFAVNMLPGHFKAPATVTTPILASDKFAILNEQVKAANKTRYGSELNPGEFSFIDEVPVIPPKAPDTTGNLFDQTTGLKLDRSPLQPELKMDVGVSPSGLRLNPFPEPPVPVSTLEVPPSGLRLENPRFESPELVQPEFPLIKLQAENRVRPDAPNFTLVDGPTSPIPVRPGDLGSWRNEAVNAPRPLLLEAPKTPAPEVGAKVPPKLEKDLKVIRDNYESKMQAKYGEGWTQRMSKAEFNKWGKLRMEAEEGVRIQNQADQFDPEVPILSPDKSPVLSPGETAAKEAFEKAKAASPKLSEEELLKGSYKARKAARLDKGKMDAAHAKGEAHVKRAPNFETEGVYEVTLPNGVKKGMFRDPESGTWYSTDKNSNEKLIATGHTFEMLSVVGKKDAIAKLMKKYGDVADATLPKAKPVIREVPEVMSPTGELRAIPPRQDGPHIISTVLDEGDGNYLSGDKWNSPHQKGDSIFQQHIELASGEGNSAFLIQDENGIIRVTTDRHEAARIAEMAGQRAPGKTGALQSEDLIDPVVKSKPQTVQQHAVTEAVADAKDLELAKKITAKLEDLQTQLSVAKWAVKEGEEGAEIEVRAIQGAIAKMRTNLKAAQGGFVTLQTSAILAASGITGLVTYQQTKGDVGSSIAAAMIVAGVAIGGTKVIKDWKAAKGPESTTISPKLPSEKIGERLSQLAKDTTSTPAGHAVGGRGGMWSNLVLGAEDLFGLNRLAFYKDTRVKAGGFVDDILNQQAAALKAVSKIKPSDSFADSTSQFIRGQLNDPVEVQRLLNSGGIISSEGGAWSKLSATEKAKYPEKWMQLDDQLNTNTKGEEVTIWHVTNAVKQQLMQAERDALNRLTVTPSDKAFAEYAIKTRDNFDTLQQVIFAAAGPKEARRIVGTMGQYVTRGHKLITDPKFYPDDATIQKAMDNLAHAKIHSFLSSVEPGPVPIVSGGKTYMTTAEKADVFNNLFTPESLKAVVVQQIKEVRAYGDAIKSGILTGENAQLQGGLFTGRKELDAVRQALLGTHTAPNEMIRDTFNKLLPAAHSAHAMLGLTAAKEASGLVGRFANDVDYNKAINELRRALPLAPDAARQRVIQNQLDELAAYVPIAPDNPSMGLFQGSFVSRHVYSQLDDITNPFGVLDSAMGKGLQKFNNLFKETHLIWNPIVQARNAVQIPAMLVIGRAAHDIKALQTAFNVVFKDHTTPVARWAIQNGSMSGNPVKGEFNFNMRELLDGSADNQIFEQFAKVRQFLHLSYSKSDDFVRTATFLAAARREAKALGIAEDVMHLDKRVTDAAREFMNRRTMDYANVPKWVKVGRQIPLVSPFLTYSHEIARITKNMAIDAAKGDLVSAAGLAGLATFPFIAQSQAEDALSPEDRKAWRKGQAAAQDYSRPRFKLPMSRNADGTFNYFDITPVMPFGDYLMMGRAMAQGDLGAVASVNPLAGIEKSPFLNLAAAQVSGKDIHTQREFRNSWDRAKNVLQAITPPHTPGLGAQYEKIAPEWLGGRLGQTNLKTGRTNTIKGALMRNILGVDESQINPDMAVNNMVKIAQHDIANERQYLNDALRSDGLSDEAKQRAMNRYIEAVRHITDTVAARMNPQF